MCSRVDFIYACSHHLSLQGEDVPHWIMVEYQNGFDMENNRWVGMWYDNGNITVDDICLVCKGDIQAREQQRNAERVIAHQEQIGEKGTDVGIMSECQNEIATKCG